MGGLLLILVSIPFFSFPKVLTHEKEKIRLTEKAAAAGSSNTTTATTQHTTTPLTKNDSGYGKDIKGTFSIIENEHVSNIFFRYSSFNVASCL